MSKKRQTKKQKIIASGRHAPITLTTSNGQAQFTISTPVTTHEPEANITRISTPSPSHAYVATDIRRTLTITTILIALDLLLYFLLKLRFVNIPGIGF